MPVNLVQISNGCSSFLSCAPPPPPPPPQVYGHNPLVSLASCRYTLLLPFPVVDRALEQERLTSCSARACGSSSASQLASKTFLRLPVFRVYLPHVLELCGHSRRPAFYSVAHKVLSHLHCSAMYCAPRGAESHLHETGFWAVSCARPSASVSLRCPVCSPRCSEISPRIKASWPQGEEANHGHNMQRDGAAILPTSAAMLASKRLQGPWWSQQPTPTSSSQSPGVPLPPNHTPARWTMLSGNSCVSLLEAQALRVHWMPVYWLMYP